MAKPKRMSIEEYLRSKLGANKDLTVIHGGETPIYPVNNTIRLDGDEDNESTGVYQEVQ